MKSCRKSVAMVLPLLIYLLTLRIGEAIVVRNNTNVEVDPKIILEEVIITGSGNDTRVIANAVAEDASTIDDQILALLSNREKRQTGHSRKTSPNSDQDSVQSRIVDVNDEDVERLKRVIAKYEPQRITRKTKRKIVNGAHDVLQGKTGSKTNLERAYDEVLRNISRRAPELISSNVDATLEPYLSQAKKNLREIYAPKARLLPANDDEAQKSRPDIDSSYTSPILKDKKTKKLLKKYSQINRIVTTPQSLPDEESRLDEENADKNESSTPERYFKVPNRRTKPKNESLSNESSNNYSESTEELGSEWSAQNSSVQTASPQSSNNNSHIFNVNNLNNFPSDTNSIQLQSRYNRMPRPFSILQAPDSAVIGIPYRKPTPSPASFNRQQVVRSSANVLPLVLPTETLLDTPSARRYVPIKYVGHPKSEEDSATRVNTEASPVTSPADERTTFVNYGVSYADVIGITKSPVNDQRRISSDYHATTENPMKQIITRTESARLIHVPSQASYTLQQEKDPQAVRGDEFLPRITAYNNPDDEKSKLNSNAELALYNKFASLYSVPKVFNVPKAVTQNYQNFEQPVQSLHTVTLQHVSTPSYVTSKPISPPMPKTRLIVSTKPALAPYYDSGLFVSQRTKGKEFKDDKKNAENVEINEPSASEENTEAADSKKNFGNHKAQINRETSKSHKTLNKQRKKNNEEEEDRENHYQQPKRIYDYQDKYYEYDEDNKDDQNDDKRAKYNVRQENNKDEEEDADETQEDEYVNVDKNEDKRNHDYQYNKHKYDKDNSEEEEKQRYDRKKYNKEKNRRDETDDHETDVKHKFISTDKYFDGPRYSDYEIREPNEKYRDRKKLAGDKKDQDEDSEDESFAEDQLVARRSKDERARKQRKEYKKKQNKDNDKTTQKRKHHRHQTIPQKVSHYEEHKREQYGETNPKHIREEYRQHGQGDNRRHDSENANEKTSDHEHGESQEHSETHKHEEHHEKKKDGGNHKFEEGGGSEHKEEHHGHDGEKGDKGYKVWHEHEKAEKGHHDKEHASKEYDEKDGEEKKHEEEGGFHKEHHEGEEGKKAAEFSEKGEHNKGHSTHGEHSVHKKDEYEKKTEFFDEFHEDGGMEKHGEHHHEHESKKGGHEKKGHHDAADHEHKYGKEEKHEKGGHHHEHKGHKVDEGHDHHYDHDEKYGKKEGHEHGKKWSFKKGNNGGDGHNR